MLGKISNTVDRNDQDKNNAHCELTKREKRNGVVKCDVLLRCVMFWVRGECGPGMQVAPASAAAAGAMEKWHPQHKGLQHQYGRVRNIRRSYAAGRTRGRSQCQCYKQEPRISSSKTSSQAEASMKKKRCSVQYSACAKNCEPAQVRHAHDKNRWKE